MAQQRRQEPANAPPTAPNRKMIVCPEPNCRFQVSESLGSWAHDALDVHALVSHELWPTPRPGSYRRTPAIDDLG
jgi:hypothetical protein